MIGKIARFVNSIPVSTLIIGALVFSCAATPTCYIALLAAMGAFQ